MKNVLRTALTFCICTWFFCDVARATHLMGGEITWECVSSGNDAGKLIFELKLYRYCAGAGLVNFAQISNPLYANYGGAASISLPLVSQTDLSIKCGDTLVDMDCYKSGRNLNSIEEFLYRSAPVLIYGLPGVYPTGTEFGYSICCRPNGVVNIDVKSSSLYYIRSRMYRFTNPVTGVPDTLGSTSNGPTCYDSSPKFAQRPAITLCSNSPYHYSHNAFDLDIDSLSYEWGIPMETSNRSVSWNTGFSNTLQFPNTSFHPNNIASSLHPFSGEMYFNIVSPVGLYSTVVKVTSYRGTQPIADTYRDVAISILNCPYSNAPPVVDFKDCPSCPLYPSPATKSVYAGDSVIFQIQSNDIGFLPNSTIAQTNYLTPNGLQFGHRFGDPDQGCLFPPCATVDTNSVYYSTPENNWSGQLYLLTTFKWVTDCNHLPEVNGYFVQSSNHTFVFNVQDNYCPIPAVDSRSFTITVKAPPPIPPPRFLCTEVINDSTVIVNWNIPVSSAQDTMNSFRYYVIYRSFGVNGPYVAIDSVDDIDTYTYTDTGVDLSSGEYYYYIKGLSSCHSQSQQIASDTIGAIDLEGQVLNQGSRVDLTWVAFGLYNEFPKSSIPEYKIWEIRGVDTTLIGQQKNTDLTLFYDDCYPEFISYFVEVYDTTKYWSCTSRSDLITLAVGDSTPPPVQLLDSVSVLSTGQAIAGWTVSPFPDLDGFVIDRCDSVLLDSLEVSESSYLDVSSGPVNEIRSYSLASYDTCSNSSLGRRELDCHATIYLELEFDKCSRRVEMNWNPYVNFRSGLDVRYKIYSSRNGMDYTLIKETNATTFVYDDLIDLSEYCFYVQAWENNGAGPFSSSSNRACETVDFLEIPDFLQIDFASVPDDKNVQVCFRTDLNLDLKSFSVFRKDNVDTTSMEVWTHSLSKPLLFSDSSICFLDSQVRVDQYHYLYMIVARNVCDSIIATSNQATSIHLKAKREDENVSHTLVWNEYKDWPNGVEEYLIFQAHDNGPFKEIHQIKPNSRNLNKKRGMLSFKHRLRFMEKEYSSYCYKIEAVEKAPFFRRKEAVSSVSNIDCLDNRPVFYVPNSFSPNEDDLNEEFKIIGSVEGMEYFNMKLFNRWGDQIFETSNPRLGWNGMHRGQPAPMGAYVYRIEYRLESDQLEKEVILGQFNLIR